MDITLRDKIVKLLHNDPDRFYTDLSAYKLGFYTETKDLFSMYNLYRNEILSHIVAQLPHLIPHYVRYEGKLKVPLHNIKVSKNIDWFDDFVIANDMNKDNLRDYIININKLNEDNKILLYSFLGTDNFSLIVNNNLRVPVKHMKDEYLNMYIKHLSSKSGNELEFFLDELDKSAYILQNYRELQCQRIDAYVMRHVTIFSLESLKALVVCGVPIVVIIHYRPQFLPLAINYLGTIKDLIVAINTITIETPISTVDALIEKFPRFEKLILDKLKTINI